MKVSKKTSIYGWLICGFVPCVVFFLALNGGRDAPTDEALDYPGSRSLAMAWRNCAGGIYLDVGTNVGVQLRKLYNPEKFPRAPVLPIFRDVFGDTRQQVCAVGFEPNSAHTSYLKTLNQWFARKNFQAFIFTETAVGNEKGQLTFYRDMKADATNHEWGASLIRNPATQGNGTVVTTTVGVVDLASFILHVVRPLLMREKARSGARPFLMMKLDIEGAELAVIPNLMLTGALCEVDLVFMEWHNVIWKSACKGGSLLASR